MANTPTTYYAINKPASGDTGWGTTMNADMDTIDTALQGMAQLAGRAGGQTLYGGTAANEDLILHGTSNSTRTTSYVLLQPSGGAVVIGAASSSYKFEVAGASGMGVLLGAVAGHNFLYEALDDGLKLRYSTSVRVQMCENARGSFGTAYDSLNGDGGIKLGLEGNGYSYIVGSGPNLLLNPVAGTVAVGTTSPDSLLHISNSTTANTSTVQQLLTLSANSTGTAAAGFGSRILWELESSTTDDQTAATLDVTWSTATHASRASNMVWSLVTAATLAEKMRLTGEGNLKLGGTASRAGTVGTNHIDIFDGTAPVGTLANGVSIYSTSGECYIMDAAGNATLQSPHDPETGEWIFFSRNTVTGRTYRVDMERMVAAIEALTGQSFTTETFESLN